MIHPLVKIITVDGFYTQQDAKNLAMTVWGLQYSDTEFGKEILNFNHVGDKTKEEFSSIVNAEMELDMDNSGVFRKPEQFIHFEHFDSMSDWIFVVALQESTFNVFEHQSGATTALDGYKYNYRNLFEWDLQINYVLKPGQGVLFRPWLFHSFDSGTIQVFRLKEKNGNN
jgi:hypothetical protein